MNILYISAEVAPFAKVGGLGDVGCGLPRALRARGHDVRIVMPGYSAISRPRYRFERIDSAYGVQTGAGEQWFAVEISDFLGVPAYLIDFDRYFARPQVYGYGDDAYRFIFLCMAALSFARDSAFRPDIVHCHDWHTAYALAWLATRGRATDYYRASAGVLTIHNAVHEGTASYDTVRFGLLDGWLPILLPYEYWGEVNWLARGVAHADMLNAVSPRYAQEIMSPPGGWSLEGLYRARAERLTGILNGIDVSIWNPATDTHLAATYSAENLTPRPENKRALQQRAGLPVRPDVPLIGFVGRLDAQKGLDYMLPAVEHMLRTQDVQFVLLGSGAEEYERRCGALLMAHSDRIGLFLEFNADLAPLLYAGCDIFLMPSLFEPCGLGQMLAMRYGAVPVVRATGGLADTVADTDPAATPPRAGTGFQFANPDPAGVGWALDRAVRVYRENPALWHQLQLNSMAQDFSWERSAREYEELYAKARAWRGV